MAIPFLNNIDLSDNQLLNAKLQVTSPPPTAAAGQIYFDTSSDLSFGGTARYYANSTDLWVSLKEYSFGNGTYINTSVTGTVAKPIITADLSAIDGNAVASERYLTKSNTWAEVSAIPGTYAWTIQADPTTPITNPTAVPSGSNVLVLGGGDMETTLSGLAFTVDLKVGPGDVGTNDNYVSNQGIAVADADDSIPFNSYTPGINPPSTQVNVVKKTTLGTIPVTALTLVKTYIDESVTGLLQFIGGFNATTGDLDSPLTTDLYTNTALAVGDLYVVSTAGDFFNNIATPLTPGDSVIVQTAALAGAAVEADFIVVQSDTDLATLTTVGLGNVNASPTPVLDGISVTYPVLTPGTASVGLDIQGLTYNTTPLISADLSSIEIPIYNGDSGPANEKIEIADLVTLINDKYSDRGTIAIGSLTGTVTHNWGTKNTIVQTIDQNGDTVFCDITRTTATVTATISVAQTALTGGIITILVQKIG